MAYAMVAIAIVGAAMAAYSAVQQSKQQAAAQKQQETLARLQQASATQQSEAQITAAREQAAREVGTIGPGYAGQGVESGSGSPLAALLDTARVGEYNAQVAGYDSRLRAVEAGYSASVYRANARYATKQAVPNAIMAAGSSLLSSYTGGAFSGGSGAGTVATGTSYTPRSFSS